MDGCRTGPLLFSVSLREPGFLPPFSFRSGIFFLVLFLLFRFSLGGVLSWFWRGGIFYGARSSRMIWLDGNAVYEYGWG